MNAPQSVTILAEESDTGETIAEVSAAVRRDFAAQGISIGEIKVLRRGETGFAELESRQGGNSAPAGLMGSPEMARDCAHGDIIISIVRKNPMGVLRRAELRQARNDRLRAARKRAEKRGYK